MKMGKRWKQWLNMLAGWLTALGTGIITSCSVGEETDMVDTVLPTANYVINGTVVSEKDVSVKIPGLQVVISHADPHPAADTCFTGEGGEFSWDNPVTTFGKDLVFTVTVTDIDGEKNQLYAPYVTVISFSKDELDSEISWFLGEGRKEVLIKMKESGEE